MSKEGAITEDIGNYNEDTFVNITECDRKQKIKSIKMGCIDPISPAALEELGGILAQQITTFLNKKGYKSTGGMYGGKEYYAYFQQDIYNLYEKPITLKLVIP